MTGRIKRWIGCGIGCGCLLIIVVGILIFLVLTGVVHLFR